MNNAPIAVFDSGQGGLSVWSELYRGLPHESLLYYGDGKNCPYGNQSKEQVTEYVDYAVRRMLEAGAKMIVIACNTATAAAIDYLRASYPVPFVGLEPAVKPAALTSRSGVIGILATAGSLKGHLFQTTAHKYADRVRIIEQVGEGFVELVENNQEESPEAYETVARLLKPMLDAGADRIVLGCTHYPFLANTMRRVIGDRDVQLINPAPAIERRVASLLEQYALTADVDHKPEYTFMTSADDVYLTRLIAKSEQAKALVSA